MKPVIVSILLIILLLTGCTNHQKRKSGAGDRTDRIPEPDKDQREEYEKSMAEQRSSDTILSKNPEETQSFIPDGYQILRTVTGDLNRDGLTDKILVLKMEHEVTISEYAKEKPAGRPLLLLLAKPDDTYQLALKNDNAVYCIDCGGIDGDPFTGIRIRNGFFSIEHGVSGNSHWERVITFKYDSARRNWLLYKDRYISYERNTSNDPDAEAIVVDIDKTKTMNDFGRVPFEAFTIYKEY